MEIVKCNLKCKQTNYLTFHHFYLPKSVFKPEEKILHLPEQLRSQMCFNCDTYGTETVLSDNLELYLLNMCGEIFLVLDLKYIF